MFVDGEMLLGEFDFAVYVSSIGIWDGSTEPVTEQERARIVANMKTALERKGVNARFE